MPRSEFFKVLSRTLLATLVAALGLLIGNEVAWLNEDSPDEMVLEVSQMQAKAFLEQFEKNPLNVDPLPQFVIMVNLLEGLQSPEGMQRVREEFLSEIRVRHNAMTEYCAGTANPPFQEFCNLYLERAKNLLLESK